MHGGQYGSERSTIPSEPTLRNAGSDLAVNLAHPPVRDRRFWHVQAMVVAIFVVHVTTDVSRLHHFLPVPDFTVNLLLFIPIIYGGDVFGLAGSFGATVTATLLTIPDELLWRHSVVDVWGEWGILATAFVVSIQVGHQYEVERRQREQLRRAERDQVAIERRTRLNEAEAHRQIERRDQLFRDAFESNTAGMFLLDGDGRLLNANWAFCEMIGAETQALIGVAPSTFTHPDDLADADAQHHRLVAGSAKRVRYSTRYLHRDGRVIFGDVSTACLVDETSRPDTFVVSVRDTTDERALLDELRERALYDPLTGLANRTLFNDRLSLARANLARERRSIAVFLLDLDDFKEVNDAFGHLVGDQLLIEFARRLRAVTRASDTLCRFGGDEFLYLAAGLTGPYEEVAERLRSVVREPFAVAETSFEQRVSVGVATATVDDVSNDELLRNADTALYEAKRLGKGRVVHFTPDMYDRAARRFELLHDLRAAIGTDQLSMAYQPLVDLATGEVEGFEALMRWRHPSAGPIAPDVFIALAEQTDLIITLGEFALREATIEAATWCGANGRLPYVSINLSTTQFRDRQLPAKLDDALASSGLDGRRLVLEVTERAALADGEQVSRVLAHLARRGVRLALDDFGTGYSSLSYLTQLRPHVIKIDRSFVSAADHGPASLALLEAMVALGRRLSLTVIAEGVETPAQRERLGAMGCQLGQGFLFSPAVDAAAARAIIASARYAPPEPAAPSLSTVP